MLQPEWMPTWSRSSQQSKLKWTAGTGALGCWHVSSTAWVVYSGERTLAAWARHCGRRGACLSIARATEPRSDSAAVMARRGTLVLETGLG